jgi:hypothetical protein
VLNIFDVPIWIRTRNLEFKDLLHAGMLPSGPLQPFDLTCTTRRLTFKPISGFKVVAADFTLAMS